MELWRGISRHVETRWNMVPRTIRLQRGDIVLRDAKRIYERSNRNTNGRRKAK